MASLAQSGAPAAAVLRRPLSAALLDYAISDVLHLHALADKLLAELERRGLMEAFRLKNLETQNTERAWDPFANYTRIPGFLPGARYAHLLTADGFDEAVDLQTVRSDPRIILAYEWNGQPLPQPHIRLDRAMEFLFGDRLG